MTSLCIVSSVGIVTILQHDGEYQRVTVMVLMK